MLCVCESNVDVNVIFSMWKVIQTLVVFIRLTHFFFFSLRNQPSDLFLPFSCQFFFFSLLFDYTTMCDSVASIYFFDRPPKYGKREVPRNQLTFWIINCDLKAKQKCLNGFLFYFVGQSWFNRKLRFKICLWKWKSVLNVWFNVLLSKILTMKLHKVDST